MISVYRITHKDTGRAYIGVTGQGIARRWGQHKRDSRNRSVGFLHRAIAQYGCDSFVVEVLAEAVDSREAIAIERGLIAQYGTMSPHGFNLTGGGDGAPGVVRSKETRERIAKATTGHVLSEESRRAMSESRRGIDTVSPEGRARWAKKMKGRKVSPEGCERMSRGMLLQYATGARKARKGEHHPLAKLTEAQVAQIFRDPRSLKPIAMEYGITMAAVSLIRTGRTWRHLTAPME